MTIVFGALAAPLWQQLQVSNGHPALRLIQKQADAVTLLGIHGILTDTDVHQARRRLVKRIDEHLSKMGHLQERK